MWAGCSGFWVTGCSPAVSGEFPWRRWLLLTICLLKPCKESLNIPSAHRCGSPDPDVTDQTHKHPVKTTNVPEPTCRREHEREHPGRRLPRQPHMFLRSPKSQVNKYSQFHKVADKFSSTDQKHLCFYLVPSGWCHVGSLPLFFCCF